MGTCSLLWYVLMSLFEIWKKHLKSEREKKKIYIYIEMNAMRTNVKEKEKKKTRFIINCLLPFLNWLSEG